MKTQNFGGSPDSGLARLDIRAPQCHLIVDAIRARGHKDYLTKRANGDEPLWFKRKFPMAADLPDSAFAWVTPAGRKFPVKRDPQRTDYFLCPTEVQYKRPDGGWFADLRLDETPLMRECMERRDLEYILLLKSQGKLLATEPKADEEILQAEQGEWQHPHQFHDKIFAAMAAARDEVKQFGKELLNLNEKRNKKRQNAKQTPNEKQRQRQNEKPKQKPNVFKAIVITD